MIFALQHLKENHNTLSMRHCPIAPFSGVDRKDTLGSIVLIFFVTTSFVWLTTLL